MRTSHALRSTSERATQDFDQVIFHGDLVPVRLFLELPETLTVNAKYWFLRRGEITRCHSLHTLDFSQVGKLQDNDNEVPERIVMANYGTEPLLGE